jgi:hypothetical protein
VSPSSTSPGHPPPGVYAMPPGMLPQNGSMPGSMYSTSSDGSSFRSQQYVPTKYV